MKEKNIKFSVEKAHATQKRLSEKILFEDMVPEKIRYVAGVDIAYARDLSIGAVVVLDYGSLKPLECKTAICKTRFPYFPTLLSFREVPPATLCIKKLQISPDVVLVDGHGFAHPYRCGFASHLGLVLRKPTVGVAKSKLCGLVEEKASGLTGSLLRDNGEVVGASVVTKNGCKPVYVSVGNMVSLETAIKIVQHCVLNARIPEPILKAHEMASLEKRKLNMGGNS